MDLGKSLADESVLLAEMQSGNSTLGSLVKGVFYEGAMLLVHPWVHSTWWSC